LIIEKSNLHITAYDLSAVNNRILPAIEAPVFYWAFCWTQAAQ